MVAIAVRIAEREGLLYEDDDDPVITTTPVDSSDKLHGALARDEVPPKCQE
jgi:hypothetical protein